MNDKVLALFSSYNGTISQKHAREMGINPTTLRRLVEKNEIENLYPGIYVLKDTMPDYFFAVQQKFSRGIFSHETALFLHGLTDLNIGEMDMSFPDGYNRKGLAQDYPVIPHTVKKEYYELGVERVFTPSMNRVNVYNMERTICDIWMKRYNADVAIRNAALKNYLLKEDKDLRLLRKYMRILPVREDLYTALEVLL
ncbi:type IV toxin-antitoxin system AbiEi family antitoxin domain-containing protein [Enterococcus hulanensis]|uniref:type IV toxin-antitoxin system AbiEi family antitoxin domain-containing protein n=1 Tax=Enterococcus hulanensis TaxID=2559929 RepID=UPI0010F60904|nr:type IV toxin-antitoxin system AbiEi family antitoxin domain-containing protein [Enterococcus hulanensis]